MNPTGTAASRRASATRQSWLLFLVLVAIYGFVGSREIDLPGIYMDAVNPDYMVARILGSGARPFVGWVAPGNDLAHRFPVLVGLHHGSMQFWLGLPFFAAFGMSVTGLRLVHMTFAVGVLAACYWTLLSAGVRRWIAFGACVALALDPAFIFAFRTQSYITMAPAALVMIALYAFMRARDARPEERTRWLVAAGALAGLACWGYFIYGFLMPAWLIAASRMPGPTGRARDLLAFSLGVVLGASPYIVGYALVAHELRSFVATWTHIITVQPGLGIAGSTSSIAERFHHIVEIVDMTLTNAWHRSLMFRDDSRSAADHAKALTLVILPFAGWIAIEWMRAATWMLRVLVGLLVSYFAVAMLFGTRMGGHHFMPLVPLLYVTTAVAAECLVARIRPAAARVGLVLGAAAIAAVSIAGDMRDFAMLRKTGGVSTFSDAINHFGADLAARRADDYLAFPDWGLFMPIAFLTHARFEMEPVGDIDRMRRALCNGRDVVVGLIEGDRAARTRALQESLRWNAPAVTPYRQRDGTVVIDAVRFAGNRTAPGCT